MKIEKLKDNEYAEFQTYIRKILKESFIQECCDEKAFKYYKRHEDTINEYLNAMGYKIIINREYNVIAIRSIDEDNTKNSLKMTLTRKQTAILAILMKLYYTEIVENGEDYLGVYVDFEEVTKLADEWSIFPKNGTLSKTKWQENLKIFRQLKFINFNDDKLDMIQLLPALSFALDTNSFSNVVKNMEENYGES